MLSRRVSSCAVACGEEREEPEVNGRSGVTVCRRAVLGHVLCSPVEYILLKSMWRL